MESYVYTLVLLSAGFSIGLYVAVIFHELGHALAARWVGFSVTSVGIGLRRPLFIVPIGGTRVYCCLDEVAVGYTFIEHPSFTVSPRQWLRFLAGGVAANALLVAASILGCFYLPGSMFWWGITAANALVALAAFAGTGNTPVKTDGQQWLQTWQNDPAASCLANLHATRTLRPLWQAIGDRRAEVSRLVANALIWHDLGDAEHARALVAEARAILPDLPFVAHVSARLLDAAAHEAASEFAEADAIYSDIDSLLLSKKDIIGRGRVTCHRAALAARRGEASAADAQLPALEECSVLERFPDMAINVLFALYHLPPSEANAARIARLREMLDKGRFSPEDAWHYQRRLAQHYIAEQDWEQAEGAVNAAWQAVAAVHRLLDAEDMMRFVQCLRPFQEATQSVLRQLGKIAEADSSAGHFAEMEALAAELRGQPDAAQQSASDRTVEVDPAYIARERRRMRIAVVLIAINAIMYTVGILVLRSDALVSRAWWNWVLLTVVMQAPFLGIAIFCLLLYCWRWLMSRHFRTIAGPGSMMLAMTTMPWIVTPLMWCVALFIRWTGW